MENIVKDFLKCSIENKKDSFNNFDFTEFFDEFQYMLKDKLNQHGLLSLNDYIEYQEEMGIYNPADLQCFTITTNYININTNDIYTNILEFQYNKLREEFENYNEFQTLKQLYNKVIEWELITDLKKLIFLVDECIHAQHVTGDILDIDIEELKEELEQELKVA
jgi:predicted transcriptional regulator